MNDEREAAAPTLAAASLPPPPPRRHGRGLDVRDAQLITDWTAAMRRQGWAASSATKAGARVAALSRQIPHGRGLLHATRHDLVVFAAVCARRAGGIELERLLRREGWANSIAALRRFYAWAEASGLIARASNPLLGIARRPPAPTPRAVTPGLARAYEILLHQPKLSDRDRALLWALAHGLTPCDVVQLRAESVNLDRRLLWVAVRGRAARAVPLSAAAAAALAPWVQRRRGRGPGAWLFPGLRGDRPASSNASSSMVRRIFYRIVGDTFARPSERALCRKLRPTGFRHLFIMEALAARLPADVLLTVVGLDRLSRLRRFAPRRDLDRVRIETNRMIDRRRQWI